MDPVAVVRRNFEAFNARDFEAVLEFVHEDWKYAPGPHWIPAGTCYKGHEGYRAMLSALDIDKADFEVSVQTRRLDPYVLAIGTASFSSPDRKLGPHPTATLHLVVDGRIRSSRGFADEGAALEAWQFSTKRELGLPFEPAPDPMAMLDHRAGRRRSRDPDAALLTPREREVLTLLALGLNGPQTAARLYISPATVRTHVENAMKALGSRTRTQAVAEALTRGEIKLEPPDRGHR